MLLSPSNSAISAVSIFGFKLNSGSVFGCPSATFGSDELTTSGSAETVSTNSTELFSLTVGLTVFSSALTSSTSTGVFSTGTCVWTV